MEISAKKTNKVFSLDKIDFEKQPRAQRVSDRTRADQRRAGRSNFGNLKDAAQTHAGRYTKLGFKSIQDRMEKDPFYLFNNAVGQITPDCCQFLEDLAQCIAPDVGRTREKREKQLGTGVSTRLIFMPDFNRDIRLPLDVTKEAMVAHHARVFTLPQFAVLAADLLKARGEPTPMLFGWSGSVMPVIKSLPKIVSSTLSILRRGSGRNNTITSRAKNTPSWMKPLHQMWLSSHWQGPPRRVLAKGERDTGVTLTRSRSQPRARARVLVSNSVRSFSRPLSAGSAVSTATNPLNVAVDGADGNSGIHMDPIKPLGRAGPMAKLELESGLLWQRMDS